MKSEPSVYSIQDLERDDKTMWEGVRNYQARNIMRDDMAPGDLVLFYHSSADPTGVAGVARVCSAAYPDPTQFDPKSKYHDPKATKAKPTWQLRDVQFVEAFRSVLPLSVLKESPELDGMMVIKRGMRLSVQPVDKQHFQRVVRMAKANDKT